MNNDTLSEPIQGQALGGMPQRRPAPTASQPVFPDGPINILIVDDEPKNLTVLETILNDPSYRLVRAESANQALLALVVDEFALIILDIRMPDMNGFELTAMIKERKKTSRVPIIFLTAYYNEDQHMLEGYGTGAVDYLHKPVNPTILRSKVSVFAELYRVGRECSTANRALLAEVTERCRAQEQLRELNETLELRVVERTEALAEANAALDVTGKRYRSLFDNSLDAVISLNPEGRFDAANPAAIRLTGHTLDELRKLQFLDLCLPEQREAGKEAFRAALRQESVALETTLVTASGEHRDLFICSAPAIVDGQLVGISCIARDVTERKRAEETLRENERRFREMVDALPAAVYTVDAQGWITHANPAALDCTGKALEVATDQWRLSPRMFRPDGTPLTHEESPMARAMKDGRAIKGEELIIERPDGTRRWIEAYPTPLYGVQGGVIGGINMLIDITDRKLAEEALQISEVRYRRLFEASKDGILILDKSTGRILDANPLMSELLGYTYDEFAGRELWEIGLFKDKLANDAALGDLKANGYLRCEHCPMGATHGARAELEIVANEYLQDHHAVIQCNVRDITERTNLERKTREQAEALADLHRRKDEFLAMLSHELRNPLAPISNAVHLLGFQRSSETPIQREACDIIRRQVGQLQRLIDDLLEVSRITTGRVQLRRERVAVSGIIESAVESVGPLIDQHRHELSVAMPPGPIWLYADAARLEQVLINLLTNAAKYTEEGGQIWLNAELDAADESSANEVIIRVRDTGVGIPESLLPRIFDLFTQAERSLDRSKGGLGIGLAVVQRLTELHGGRVEAYSKLEQGSEFVVRLPLAPHDAPAPPPGPEVAPSTSRPLRVLVVDDNVDAAQTLEMLLKSSRHEVRMAHDGPSTLDVASEFQPNVVVLDIGLPRMDGYEVARRMRQIPSYKDVVLVALTGYGQDSDRQTSRNAGFDHHMVKPADFAKLQQILADVAERLI